MKRDPNTGHFLPANKRSAALRTAASSIGRVFRGNPSGLSAERYNALVRYAQRNGRRWKFLLSQDWMYGTERRHASEDDAALLRQIRNLPSFSLERFSFAKARVNPSRPKKRTARKASPKRRTVKRTARKVARRSNPRGGAAYVVTIRNLSTGATTSAAMRSPVTETERELYTRAVKKLRGRGFWFHPDLPGHPSIGRIASSARGGGTDLHERVRIDTERA